MHRFIPGILATVFFALPQPFAWAGGRTVGVGSKASAGVYTSVFAQGEHTPDTLLVRFRPAVGMSTREGMRASLRADKLRDFGSLVPGLQEWRIPAGMKLDDALRLLKANPNVAYAEVDHIHHVLQLLPNDPKFSLLWGLNNTGQTGGVADADVDAPEAWATSTGAEEVIVGVVDTGIDYNHQDLTANIWTNPGEIPGNGIDDDANGYVDDLHGMNAVTGSGDPLDDHDHGTHCSGTIGATGNNNLGVVGINWTVKLMGLKFLDAGGSGTTAGAIEAINYAVMMKRDYGVNLRALSNSWGGGGFEQALLDAINAAGAQDILFVAAAGNDSVNNDLYPHYPSSYEALNLLAVAATDSTDAMSWFSNYGPSSVDLGAPGSGILSTTRNNTYSSFDGTSMATPHVTGAAALLWSYNPNLTTLEVKDALLATVDVTAALNGKVVSGGRLNVGSAMAYIPAPGPDFRLAASPFSQTITQGQSATTTVTTTSLAGFTGNITLDVTSSPSMGGATFAFSANPVSVGNSSVLTVATTAGTTPGTYTITINGTSAALVHSANVQLLVEPEGLVTVTFDNHTITSIPDNTPAGINSTIQVNQGLNIYDVWTTVDITHTYIGDLVVTLSSPTGTTVTLHNREGGSADNIHQTYQLPSFNGEAAAGTWTLHVSDNAGIDLGTLDHWGLLIKGFPASGDTQPPTVAITSPANGATVSGTVNVTANASDDTGVTEVLFYVNGLLIGSSTAAPYGVAWDTTSIPDGSYPLTAETYDAAGNLGQSAPISVTVYNWVPADIVDITSAEWRSSKKTLRVKGTVSDPHATLAATFAGRTEPMVNNNRSFDTTFRNVAANPGTVTVTSSGGGSDTASVRTK